MPFPTRKATLAAAAAFCLAFPLALAACGGGGGALETLFRSAPKLVEGAAALRAARDRGGEQPIAGGAQDPNRNPEEPQTLLERIFPLEEGQVVGEIYSTIAPFSGLDETILYSLGSTPPRYDAAFARTPIEGATLDNLISRLIQNHEERDTYSIFPEFGTQRFATEPLELGGIPIRTGEVKQHDRYANLAYAAILNHSINLIQVGIYPNTIFDGTTTTGFYPGVFAISVGEPAAPRPIAGIWNGLTLGIKAPYVTSSGCPGGCGDFRPTEDEVWDNMVLADVTISATSSGSVNMEFANWEGTDHPSVNIDMEKHNSVNGRYYYYTGLDYVNLQFYGPSNLEAGGVFRLQKRDEYSLNGGFITKKQP